MRKLPLLFLIAFFTVLFLLLGYVSTASAYPQTIGDNFSWQRQRLAAEANDLTLTSSNAFTIYLPIILGLPPFNPKKGLGVIASPACADLVALRGSWYLNWSVNPDPNCGGVNNRFVPRIANALAMSAVDQAVVNAQASGWLIGFSEPNLPGLNNVSPTQGAIYWSQIEAAALPLGIKLVSPSPNQYNPGQSDPYGHQWTWYMVDAYRSMYGLNPHFDAIGWNIYKQNPADTQAFLIARRNEALARGYDVPVWVLEYGGECWNSANGNTGNQAIMTAITPWFDATPWIGRYAWFANRITGSQTGAPGWQSCSLIGPSSGVLTGLGQLYTQY